MLYNLLNVYQIHCSKNNCNKFPQLYKKIGVTISFNVLNSEIFENFVTKVIIRQNIKYLYWKYKFINTFHHSGFFIL